MRVSDYLVEKEVRMLVADKKPSFVFVDKGLLGEKAQAAVDEHFVVASLGPQG